MRECVSLWISWIAKKNQLSANQQFMKTNIFVWITLDHFS